MKKTFVSLCLSMLLLFACTTATAGVISVNWDGSTNVELASDDVAGVVPVANWNNIDGFSTGITDALDDTAAATTLDLAVAGGGGEWRETNNPAADPDSQMLEGVIFSNEGGWTITGTGVPYSTYDLYVYVPADTDNRDYKVTVTGPSITSTTFWYDAMIPNGGYTEATTTTDPGGSNAADGNYALFTGLTGDFTITMQGHAPGPDASTNPMVAGLQVVNAIPEPNCCYPVLLADFDTNCVVDIYDLQILGNYWLQDFQDSIRTMSDFAQLGSEWLSESESVPNVLCGMYLVGYDDCGVPGQQPNLVQGNDRTYTELEIPSSVVPLDSPARTISYHDTEVIYHYAGLRPAELYRVRITYLSDTDGRSVDFTCDGAPLRSNVVLPDSVPEVEIVTVPSASYQDGQIDLGFSKNAGADAVVSEIELWSSDPSLATMRIEVTDLLDDQIEILVTDNTDNPLVSADVTIAVENTALSEMGTTDQNGEFLFTIPILWKQYGEQNLAITAEKDGISYTIYVPFADYFSHIPQYTPRPVTVAGVAQHQVDLTGIWNFHAAPPADFWTISSFPPAGWSTIEVPSEWVMQGFTVADNQAAGYLREFTVPADWAGERVKLRCDAVYSDADVYVNGQYAGSHLGGMTPFELDVTYLTTTGAVNTIALAVTNESSADRVARGTYYAAHKLGGITRKIYLFAVPELSVSRLDVTTDFDASYVDATLHLDVEIVNAASTSADTAQLDISLKDPDGQAVTISPSTISLASIGSGLSLEEAIDIPITAPAKWDCEHPNLYELTCTLSDGQGNQEEIVEKIGFREIEVRGNQLYVNDQPVKLRGVNRHESDALRGRSLTDQRWQQDAQLFRASNCNYIRTSHYPPAEEFIEYCDQYGLFVEEEAPFSWADYEANTLSADQIFPVMTRPTLEMVQRDRNRPSVIYWSMGNESRGWVDYFKDTQEMVKQVDPSRPTIFSQWNEPADNGDCEIGNDHYPGPNGVIKYESWWRPVVFDEFCHLNTYNRYELVTDQGVRDDWVRGLKPMWESMYSTTGCLGGAIWSGVDDAFHLPSGDEVGYGYWGPIDSWRRTRPEYWHMKKVFSPIQITSTTLTTPVGSSIDIPLSNRFDFTNVNELTINWSVDSNSGTASANISPRSSGTLTIDTGISNLEGKVLDLQFDSPLGYQIDHYKLQIGQATVPQPPSMSGSAQYTQGGGVYTITAGNDVWKINQSTGLITEGRKNGQLIVTGGPHLMLLPLNKGGGTQMTGATYAPYTAVCSNWSASAVQVSMDGSFVKVEVTGTYSQASGSYTLRFDGTGQMELDYNFTSSIDVKPRQTGMTLDIVTSCDTLNWLRTGEWTTYPADHIGRLSGQAELYGPTGVYTPRVHRVEPTVPWSGDMTELGTNDFRSTKRSIYNVSLKDSSGRGLVIYSDSSQHTRSYKEGSLIRTLIANFATGGDDRFFSPHYAFERIEINVGDTIADTVHVQIVE